MTTRYSEILDALRLAYDDGAAGRDKASGHKTSWKIDERSAFLARLWVDGLRRVLEVGAGTGQDGLFFKENDLEVTATDLSPQMVERCRAKGLPAHVMDFLHLDFAPASFDAVNALNCLLHVPNADLSAVLDAIERLMCAKGLLYIGLYGGDQREGEAEHDPGVRPSALRHCRLPRDRAGASRLSLSVVDAEKALDGPECPRSR